jgi:hypothetical protein
MEQGNEISLSDVFSILARNTKLILFTTTAIMSATIIGLCIHHFTKPVIIAQQLHVAAYKKPQEQQPIQLKATALQATDYINSTILPPYFSQLNSSTNLNLSSNMPRIKNPDGMLNKKGLPIKSYTPDSTLIEISLAVPNKKPKSYGIARNTFQAITSYLVKSQKEVLNQQKTWWLNKIQMEKNKITLLKTIKKSLAVNNAADLTSKFNHAEAKPNETNRSLAQLITTNQVSQFGLTYTNEITQAQLNISQYKEMVATLKPAQLQGTPFIKKGKSYSLMILLSAFVSSILLSLLAVAIKESKKSSSH